MKAEILLFTVIARKIRPKQSIAGGVQKREYFNSTIHPKLRNKIFLMRNLG